VPELEKSMRIREILKYLPHRYPFLLVDQVLDYEPGQWLTAIKNVSVNEPFFTGHFPENPVMPGVLMIESLAQAGGILAYLTTQSTPKDDLFYLGSISNAKFKQMVLPGDVMTLNIKCTGNRGDFWKVHGEATVNGKLACVVDILSAMRKNNP